MKKNPSTNLKDWLPTVAPMIEFRNQKKLYHMGFVNVSERIISTIGPKLILKVKQD
jgi:hypothetical protein